MENSTPAVAAAWSVSFDDLLFVRSFLTASRLGCAVQLLQFRLHARFFDNWAEIALSREALWCDTSEVLDTIERQKWAELPQERWIVCPTEPNTL